MTLNDLERPIRTLMQKRCVFWSTVPRNFARDDFGELCPTYNRLSLVYLGGDVMNITVVMATVPAAATQDGTLESTASFGCSFYVNN